ncbi:MULTISPECIES: thioredoxin [Deinococcus]|uniref:thioredoxin n=1 Tax=Deinococcus TaxID=1298 RepID=UPI000051B659|nr:MULTISPECIES: thioredoxin [Deinococcus]MBI0445395.1 thioredoxin [Deinococcus sp. DB0503]
MPKPFLLLTQANCPACVRLERMLSGPLRGAYWEQIEVVRREDDERQFLALAGEYGVRSTPALVERGTGRQITGAGSLHEVRLLLGV